ncbi:MAG: helix-turn-helix domain-containing protein [Nitrospiraceae bacterium]|nr:helix-turn-helix domain-containing protein [Nitrospiraceae bacterium]
MAKRRNPKLETLRNQGTLNPHPEQVRDELFLGHDFFDPHDLLQVKYEMLRKRRVEGVYVTQAAEVFGFSRPSFYQALEAFEAEGLSGLIPHRRGPKQAHKLTEAIMAYVRDALTADESLRTADLVRMVGERFDVHVHPRSLERALARGPKKGL